MARLSAQRREAPAPSLDEQAFFEALADPIRRRILAMLLDADERCVCDLHGALAAPQPKVSRHLGGVAGGGPGAGPARRGLDALPHPSAAPGLGAAGPDPHAGRDRTRPIPGTVRPGRALRTRSQSSVTQCTLSKPHRGLPMTTPPKTVLVLCTGNSCRSQMAEVLLNHDLAGQVRALSAGTRPQPKVADGAIAALQAGRAADRRALSQGHRRRARRAHRPGGRPSATTPRRAARSFRARCRASICPSMTRTASRWSPSSQCATTSAPDWCRRYARRWGLRHDRGDPDIHPDLPPVQAPQRRDHAHRRLPVVLRVPGCGALLRPKPGTAASSAPTAQSPARRCSWPVRGPLLRHRTAPDLTEETHVRPM